MTRRSLVALTAAAPVIAFLLLVFLAAAGHPHMYYG